MEELIKKLDDALLAHFHGATAELEEVPPLPKVTGLISWNGFEGREQIDRQHEVWDLIRHALMPEDQRRITVILTVTPEELAYMREK